MKKVLQKALRATFFLVKRIVGAVSPSRATAIAYLYYKNEGMNFQGKPNYISSTAWFDGTNYSLISIGYQTTISSNVSVLTHDWALHTIGKSMGVQTKDPLGKIRPVSIGNHCFIGRGAILMPGCTLGNACIVGAGAVVRGEFEDHSIIVGNVAECTGKSDEYFLKMATSKSDH